MHYKTTLKISIPTITFAIITYSMARLSTAIRNQPATWTVSSRSSAQSLVIASPQTNTFRRFVNKYFIKIFIHEIKCVQTVSKQIFWIYLIHKYCYNLTQILFLKFFPKTMNVTMRCSTFVAISQISLKLGLIVLLTWAQGWWHSLQYKMFSGNFTNWPHLAN